MLARVLRRRWPARWLAVALLVMGGGAPPGARGDEAPGARPPSIVRVTAPARPRVGAPGEIRVTYRAPRGNVTAVILTTEDVDGPLLRRATRQREFNVIATAFGREDGELAVPLTLASVGRKRVTVVLVTDERAESDPLVVELDVDP